MGCSAAKSITVEPLDGSLNKNNSHNQIKNRNINDNRKLSMNYSKSDELLSTTEINDDLSPELIDNSITVNKLQKGMNGLSFEIEFSLQDESIIKKHPPKKFKRFDEQKVSPSANLMKLQEKLDEAQSRRQELIKQRIQSAKYRNILKKQGSKSSFNEYYLTLSTTDNIQPTNKINFDKSINNYL